MPLGCLESHPLTADDGVQADSVITRCIVGVLADDLERGRDQRLLNYVFVEVRNLACHERQERTDSRRWLLKELPRWNDQELGIQP